MDSLEPRRLLSGALYTEAEFLQGANYVGLKDPPVEGFESWPGAYSAYSLHFNGFSVSRSQPNSDPSLPPLGVSAFGVYPTVPEGSLALELPSSDAFDHQAIQFSLDFDTPVTEIGFVTTDIFSSHGNPPERTQFDLTPDSGGQVHIDTWNGLSSLWAENDYAVGFEFVGASFDAPTRHINVSATEVLGNGESDGIIIDHFRYFDGSNDLVAGKVMTSGAVQPGSSLPASVTIVKRGPVTVSGDEVTDYYLSPTSDLNTLPPVIKETHQPITVTSTDPPPQQSVDIAVPQDTTPGTYWLIAKINAHWAISETSDADNFAVSSPITVGLQIVATDATDMPQTEFRIDANGNMPPVKAQILNVNTASAASLTFAWTTRIDMPAGFAGPEQKDAWGGPPDIQATANGAVYSPQFASPANSTIGYPAGGNLTMHVTGVVDGVTLSGDLPAGVKILADNPSEQQIFAEIDADIDNKPGLLSHYPSGSTLDIHNVVHAIAQQESLVEQFDDDGYPVFNGGGDGGAGVMQVTSGVAYRDIWDWRANVRDGVAIFASALEKARRTPSQLPLGQTFVGELSATTLYYKLTAPGKSLTVSPYGTGTGASPADAIVHEAILHYNCWKCEEFWPAEQTESGGTIYIFAASPAPDGSLVIPWVEQTGGYVSKVLSQDALQAKSGTVVPTFTAPTRSDSTAVAWQAVGLVQSEDGSFGVGTLSGQSQVLVHNHDPLLGAGSPATDVESFLGLAAGALDALQEGTVVGGSAIKQTFTAVAGDTVQFNCDFLTSESGNLALNDFLVVLLNSTPVAILADAYHAGLSAAPVPQFTDSTGYRTFSYAIASAGQYTLAIAVLDVGDEFIDSAALISNLSVRLPGDANGDGNVNFGDLLALAQDYGKHPVLFDDGDFNADGSVGFADLLILAQHYDTRSPSAPYAVDGLAEGNLSGQDGWQLRTGSTPPLVAIGDGSDQTLVFKLVDPAYSGIFSDMSRANDSAFSFPAFSATETAAVMSFDALLPTALIANWSAVLFGLGHGGDVGPTFGFRAYGPSIPSGTHEEISASVYQPQYGVPNEVLLPTAFRFGDWVRFALTMDFTANDGDGAGSLSCQDLTAGAQPITVLQNVDLKLGLLPIDSRNPSTWDQMFLRFSLVSGGTFEIDNLTPHAVAASPAVSVESLVASGNDATLHSRKKRVPLTR